MAVLSVCSSSHSFLVDKGERLKSRGCSATSTACLACCPPTRRAFFDKRISQEAGNVERGKGERLIRGCSATSTTCLACHCVLVSFSLKVKVSGSQFQGSFAKGVVEHDAAGYGALRVQHGAILRRCCGGREGLLQVSSPARRQLARRRLCCNNLCHRADTLRSGTAKGPVRERV